MDNSFNTHLTTFLVTIIIIIINYLYSHSHTARGSFTNYIADIMYFLVLALIIVLPL